MEAVLAVTNKIIVQRPVQRPLPRVMAATAAPEPGQAFAIITPFIPAPTIGKVRQKGTGHGSSRRAPSAM